MRRLTWITHVAISNGCDYLNAEERRVRTGVRERSEDAAMLALRMEEGL